MKQTKIPSLALAVVLQIMPVCRVATLNPAVASSSYAIVVRCAVAIAALLGSVDAVSGASTPVYVAGVQRLLPSPSQPVSTNVTGPVGSPMVLRIILGGSVGLQPQLDFYNATPLPPGLIINTNVNTNSVGLESTNYYIYGTPTVAGVYFPVTVSAGNLLYPTGPVSTDIRITITNAGGASPPSFTTQPQSRTVTNGSNVSFTVVAAGSPAPTLQWRKNGTNLAGATTATYAISPTTTNSAGNYTCLASNSSGSVTSTVAVLTVLDPPSIATQPQSLTVTNGATASFQILAAGLPPPALQWRKNGINLAGETAATYTISPTTTNSAANYTCLVSNSAGSVTSLVAVLTVLDPPSIATQPQSLTVSNGSTASFQVVAFGIPPPTYQWKFNGTNLAGATAATFVINSAQTTNAGDYTVLVSNSVSSVLSAPAHLTVQVELSAPSLGNLQLEGGLAAFDVTGPPNVNVVVLSTASLDSDAHLTVWTPVRTNASVSGTWHFQDTAALPVGPRFYRAVLQP